MGLRYCAIKLAEWYLPTALNFADLTLATSPQLAGQLQELGCKNVEVWRKGVDTDVFSSKFNESNTDMRSAMTQGQPHRPLLLYVAGRLEEGRSPFDDVACAHARWRVMMTWQVRRAAWKGEEHRDD